MNPLRRVSEPLASRLTVLRRDLHRHPELAGREEATSGRISRELERLGIGHRTGVGGFGVVADIPGTAEGPTIALRADIDALPLQEATGLEFASLTSGVMHACGHDGHTSMLIGAAALLAAQPPPCPVRLIFQPAEETGGGAMLMIADGALDGVDAIFGGHIDPGYPAGSIVVTEGAVNAASDYFTVHVGGRMGHSARPHLAKDAVVVGSFIVVSLQTIVSREIDPGQPAVISVGRFSSGTAGNVIAGSAVLDGTIRSMAPEVRKGLGDAVRRVATETGRVHGCEVTVDLREGNPAVINDPVMTSWARETAHPIVGAGRVARMASVNMGSEDFGRYLQRVPGCYVRFGASTPGAGPAHSDLFDFDESALALGAEWLAAIVDRAAHGLMEA